MDSIILAVMIFSLGVLIWGTLCLIYSMKIIKTDERYRCGDDSLIQ